jgi:transcription elongation factor B polypeptide 3
LFFSFAAIEDLGWVPYFLMEPVLSRASAPQLAKIEHYNPQIMEDTNDLWRILVQAEFRGAEREDEDEEWRDVYKVCNYYLTDKKFLHS